MPVFVKASRRAKAYTRRAATGPGTAMGFKNTIRKGGKSYSLHIKSKNRLKVETFIREQRNYGTRTWIMKGSSKGFAAYWRER